MSQAGSYIYLKSDLRSRPLWGIYISIQPDIDEIYPIFKEFSSPMEYLYFYSGYPKSAKDYNEFSSPMGYLYFYSVGLPMKTLKKTEQFSSPMGYLYFYSITTAHNGCVSECSRPLWGIYISIQYEV